MHFELFAFNFQFRGFSGEGLIFVMGFAVVGALIGYFLPDTK